MIEVNATQLRKNIYKLLDHVAESGEPIKIIRKGKELFIKPAKPVSKLKKLEKHPDFIIGDPEDLLKIDWSEEWTPDL